MARRAGSARAAALAMGAALVALLVVAALLPLPTGDALNHGATGHFSPATPPPTPPLPVWFIANQGQAPAALRFTASDGSAAFLASAVLLRADEAWVRVDFPGARQVEPAGEAPLAQRSHFFRGGDPAAWRTDVPNYERVVYRDLYPGIDLVYRAAPGGLKYDWVVHPGGDPTAIRQHYPGATVRIAEGELVVEAPGGRLREAAPLSRQGEAAVDSAFIIAGESVAYELGPYDSARELVIDPLVFATFVGGSESDNGYALALDADGDLLVTGDTYSSDFPTTAGVHDDSFNGARDIFVFKLAANGSALLWATFVGGDDDEVGHGIAVDADGNAYVTGRTQSADFPTTAGAYDTTHNGGNDVVVFKLAPDGSALTYSTFVGGSDYEVGFAGVAVDGQGNAYVAGHTNSANFPTTPGAYDRSYYCCGWDGFAFKLNPDGSDLAYSTYFGGYDYEGARSLALDSSGNLYLTGDTTSTDYPTTSGAYDETYNGGRDDFALKFNRAGSDLVFSTFLGGSDDDIGAAITLASDGSVWVTGETQSQDFPTTATAYDESHNGGRDIFLSHLSEDASELVYSTFIGGADHDYGYGLAVEGAVVSLTGWSWSADFPVTDDAFNTTLHGDNDVVALRLDTGSSSLNYSTFIGGSEAEKGQGLAMEDGDFIITGFTKSPDFPTTPGAYDRSYNGDFLDVFVLRLDPTAEGGPGEGDDDGNGGGSALPGPGLALAGLALAAAARRRRGRCSGAGSNGPPKRRVRIVDLNIFPSASLYPSRSQGHRNRR